MRGGLIGYMRGERILKEWIVSQRSNKRAVTTVMIRLKAKDLAKEFNATDFTGGPSWCNRFMRRNQLSVHTRTTVGQHRWSATLVTVGQKKTSHMVLSFTANPRDGWTVTVWQSGPKRFGVGLA